MRPLQLTFVAAFALLHGALACSPKETTVPPRDPFAPPPGIASAGTAGGGGSASATTASPGAGGPENLAGAGTSAATEGTANAAADPAASGDAGPPPREINPAPAPSSAEPPPAEADAGSGIAAEQGPCKSDKDCGFTSVAAGACCPMLCEPRVVLQKRAAALEAKIAHCHKGECPVPFCRPPRRAVSPVCVEHRCTEKRTKRAETD